MRLFQYNESNKMKLNIILFFICAFLIYVITQYQELITQKEHQIKIQQNNQTLLTQQIRKIYNEKIILEQENEELVKTSKTDSFNWYQDISNTNVIKRLQKN